MPAVSLYGFQPGTDHFYYLVITFRDEVSQSSSNTLLVIGD